MSQEKIKEILIALQDSDSINPNTKRERFLQALNEINKIVMECLPDEIAAHSLYEDEEQGRVRGHNEAIAEFMAKWEGK